MGILLRLSLGFLALHITSSPAASAESWQEIERAAETNPRQVIEDAGRALHQAQAQGDEAAQLQALLRRAIAYYRLKDFAQARRYWELSLALARELRLPPAETAMVELGLGQLAFDAQLIDAENGRQRAQQQEAEARARVETQTHRAMLMLTLMTVLLLGSVAFWLRQRAATARAQAEQHQALAASTTRLAAIEAELERERTRHVLVHAGKVLAVGRLAAGIAHEMSHPVAAMSMLTDTVEVLLDAGRDDEAAEVVVKMTREVKRLTDLLQRIKNFSRSKPPQVVALPLRAAFDDARQLFASRLGLEAIDYREAVDPVIVRADAEQLSLVIANLVFNAADAVRDAAKKTIEVTSRMADGMVVVSIRDSGTGLSPDALQHLFEPFFTTKPEGEGLGLGLSLSIEALVSMNGRIDAANHPGGGAVFRLYLPVEEESRNGSPMKEVDARKSTIAASARPRV